VKKILLMFCILFTFLTPAYANTLDDIWENQLDSHDVYKIDDYVNSLNKDYKEIVPDFSLNNIIQQVKNGQFRFDFLDFLKKILAYVFRELLGNIKLLSTVFVLAIIVALFENLQATFMDSSISKVTYWVCGLTIISIIIVSLTTTITIAREAIIRMLDFFNALLPLLLSLLTAMGKVSSATILSPLVITMTGLFAHIISNVVLPLIYLSTVVYLLDALNDQFKMTNLAKLLKDLSIGLLGILLTLYVGILGIQGVASNVSDNLAMETAKFATGSFIPVVGKFFSDAIGIIVGTSLLLKNAVSLFGVIVIAVMCLLPLIKILAIVIIYRITAALVEPIGAKRISSFIDLGGNCLLLVFGALATASFIFFMTIGIIIAIGKPF
jgi:stage III sporulation protein AE